MINKIILIIVAFLSTSIYAMSQKTVYSEDQIDDWEYNSTIKKDFITKRSKNMTQLKSVGMPSPMMMSASPENLGFAVGGAKVFLIFSITFINPAYFPMNNLTEAINNNTAKDFWRNLSDSETASFEPK